MNSMGVGPSQQPDRSEQRPVMANRGRWAQIGPRFGALTTSLPTDVAASGKGEVE